MDCVLEVTSNSEKVVIHLIISILSFIIDKTDDFFNIIFLLGLAMVQPLSSFSRVYIIGTLMNTHSVPDDHVSCLELWTESCGVCW